MAFREIVFTIILTAACVHALPVWTEESQRPALGLPIFLEDSPMPRIESEDEKYPATYVILLRDSFDNSALDDKEIESSDSAVRGKRRTQEELPVDDLETAAGTNVLRPLFVYRQQIAYRQRVRNNRSRRYRF